MKHFKMLPEIWHTKNSKSLKEHIDLLIIWTSGLISTKIILLRYEHSLSGYIDVGDGCRDEFFETSDTGSDTLWDSEPHSLNAA